MATLAFQSISIRALPGMPRGINKLEELSPRINIIIGPNGAGKSSTARYIHRLVWGERMPNQIAAIASFQIGDDHWVAGTEGGTSSFQKNGNTATPTGLPAREARPAYLLALHDLVVAEDKELAGEIMRESIGGYDLEGVREKLGYSCSIKSTRSGEYTAYKNALQEVSTIQTAQNHLKKQEQRLSELRQKLEKANLAKQEEAFYKLYHDYLKASERVEKLDSEFKQFPSSVQKAKEDDTERIDSLEANISAAEKAINNAKTIINKNRNKIALLKLTENNVDEITVNLLDNYINDLGQAERDIAEESKNKTEFETKAEESLRGIGSDMNEEAWQGIDLPAIHELDKFLLDAYRINSKYEANRLKINIIREELESLPDTDSTKIIHGIGVLQTWLKNQNSFFGVSDTWLILLTVVAIITALATWLFGLPGLIAGVVATLAVAFLGYSKKPAKTEKDYASEYAISGLEQPDAWTSSAVLNLLEKLLEELTFAKKREALQQSLKDFQNDQKTVEQQLEVIRDKHAAFQQELKAVPGLPESGTDSYAGMYHFMTRIKEWQLYNAKAQVSNAIIKDLQEKHQHLLEKINGQFNQFECRLAGTHAEAKAELGSLKQKVSAKNIALNEINQQEIILKNNEQKKQECEVQLKAIYERLEVDVGMRHEVNRLVNLLPGFHKVQIDLNHEQRNLQSARKQLEGHELFTERSIELNSLNTESTEIKISDCERIWAGRDEIIETIKEINLRVDNEKESRSMELAIYKRDMARIALETLFEQNLGSATGQLIHDELSAEIREKAMPEVFTKAKEVFNEITKGRYELIIDHTTSGAFRALDKVLGMGQNLDELSTGTRIQLLLAVRLAYIESREAGLKLPLIVDEVLANSDDQRSGAIIEAVNRVSSLGRQVFYFTARSNELIKWAESMQQEQTEWKKFELTVTGNEEAARIVADSELPNITFLEQVTKPGSMTHKEYGKQLRIQPFDPVNDKIEQLHLWYLTEDNTLLYNLLTQGITFWGQLQSYVSHSGTMIGLDRQIFKKMQQKVLLLKHFCELYQTGRPKSIGIEALTDSNVVNNTFIDRVNEVLKTLNGNPEALIHALEAGEVARFRTTYIEALKNYFIEQQYIDEREIMGESELKLRMQAYKSQLDIPAKEAESFLSLVFEHLN